MKKKEEFLYATLIAIVVFLIANAPVLLFYIFPKQDLVFLGRQLLDDSDVYTYVSYIEQAKQGHLVFINKFTSEPQNAALIRPSYALIGTSAKILHISSIGAYHLAQVVFSAIFFLITYVLIRKVFASSYQRILAFFVLLTSSGLYWLVGKLIPSTDFYAVESNTFLSLRDSPHFILSQAIMISGVLLYANFLKEKKWKYGLLSALALFPLAYEHPFDLVILAPVFFLAGVWVGIPWLKTVVISLFVALPILIPYLELKQNAIFAAEQAQGALTSPSPFAWIFGFGLLLPLAVFGIHRHFKKSDPLLKILIVWIVIVPILVYLPVSFQRRLSEGVHIPLTILATLGLIELYSVLKKECASVMEVTQEEIRPFIKLFILSIVAVLCITPVLMTNRDINYIGNDSLQKYYYFVSVPDYEAIDWIKNNIPEDSVILSNWFYGNIIAGSTIRQVYLGHRAQTIDYDKKVDKVNSFLLNNDNTSALQFLNENRIDFIFLSKYDSIRAYGFKPEQKPYLERIYEHEGVEIYKVRHV